MKNILFITVFCFSYLLNCEAQFFFGPTVGINQYFIDHKELDYFDYETRAKVSPNYGLKTEVWLTKYLFLSTIHRLSNNKNEINLVSGNFDDWYYASDKYKHLQTALLINKNLDRNIGIGLGINHSYSYKVIRHRKGGFAGIDNVYKDSSFKLHEWGSLVSISKAINSIVFEMNYTFSTGNIGEGLRKFSHAIQFNVSYLFKTNLRFSKKGIDCPRF